MGVDQVIAVDLGGTHLRAARITRDGTLTHHQATETRANEGVAAVIDRICALVEQVAHQAGVAADTPVGIVAPGPLDPVRGVIHMAPNLPGWHDVPLKDELVRRLKRPIVLGNDGNGAALGEALFGAARGARHIVHCVIGTGFGGGIITHGLLVEGVAGLGAEVGHVPVDPNGPRCHCGGIGCLEAFVSGWALARDGEALVQSGRSPSIAQLAGGQPVTADIVTAAARQGDPAARAIFVQAGRALAVGLAGLINLFNPEVIVLGGGVAEAGELLTAPLQQWLPTYAMPHIADHVRIVTSSLGPNVGLYGAAARAFLVSDGVPPNAIRLPDR